MRRIDSFREKFDFSYKVLTVTDEIKVHLSDIEKDKIFSDLFFQWNTRSGKYIKNEEEFNYFSAFCNNRLIEITENDLNIKIAVLKYHYNSERESQKNGGFLHELKKRNREKRRLRKKINDNRKDCEKYASI